MTIFHCTDVTEVGTCSCWKAMFRLSAKQTFVKNQ